MQLHNTAPAEAPEPTSAPITNDGALFRRMLDQRRVMLTGAIDSDVAERICAQLLVLEADDPTAPITLYLHSPGGEVDAGFAIYDTMQALECEVATVCLGFAASMAQFLLCAGARGQRFADAHSRILMHQPLGAVQGYAVDVAIQAEQFSLAKQLMAELIAQHTGQPAERILADGDRDRWFTANEALEYGMIDEVIVARR